MEQNPHEGTPSRRGHLPGEYAESYLAKSRKLDDEIASVAQALTDSPEDKKGAYEKFLKKLKDEKIKLMRDHKILPPN